MQMKYRADMGVKVFISYTHKDREVLEQFQRFLIPLERKGLIDPWDDARIKPGNDWKAEIDKALADPKVAVLFISQDFLASKFISEEELPHLLAARTRGDLTIIPVFLDHSNIDLVCGAHAHTGLRQSAAAFVNATFRRTRKDICRIEQTYYGISRCCAIGSPAR
jgi:hypothetical protein